MRTNPDDPAFIAGGNGAVNPNMGLTKREYFAAMALQGIVSYNPATFDIVAEMARRYADALIEALNNADAKH